MKRDTLDILRCPFCGARLELADAPGARASASNIEAGSLCCSCEAFPVVDGIPYLISSERGSAANEAIGLEDHTKARQILLEIDSDPDRCAAFQSRLQPSAATFREMLGCLGTGQECDYFLYRFSDPYFITSEYLVRSIAADRQPRSGRAIDLCGGAGHLTRAMTATGAFSEVWLADLTFWKVWLASRFIAPDAIALACDCGAGLPLDRGAFSLVLCSGAFEYVWNRRVFGEEMLRLLEPCGLLLVTHLKNLNCATFNPGMSLTPAGYRSIFSRVPTVMTSEPLLLRAILSNGRIDLSENVADELLDDEACLMLASALDGSMLKPYSAPPPTTRQRSQLNPLYKKTAGAANRYEVSYPSQEYADEFGESALRLPETIDLDSMSESEAIRRRVLLDLPERYL